MYTLIYLFFLHSDADGDINQLKVAIDRVTIPFGGVDLAKALETGQQLFDPSQGARANARKILVLITDRESDSSIKDVKEKSKELEREYIRVIPVSLGGPDNDKELNETTPVKTDLIPGNKTDSSSKISREIIKRTDKGTS